MNDFPYGNCECTDHCGCVGPASLLVKRDEKDMKVCTRCMLSADDLIEVLVKDTDKIGPFVKHDLLGSILLTMKEEA